VPAGASDGIDDESAQFIGKRPESIPAELTEIPRIVDGLEQCM